MAPTTSNSPGRLAAALIAILAGLMLAGVPAAGAALPPRVTIGVYGDSVVEGYTISNYLTDSLVPRLQADVAQIGGFEGGAPGFVPVSVFRWQFNEYTVAGTDEVPRPDAWTLAGFAAQYRGTDGLSGYSAIGDSPVVSASAPVHAPTVAILFTKFPGSGVFTVTAGDRTFAIDARSSGPPTPAEEWLALPPGTQSITVHGPASGSLIFNGMLDRAPVDPGRIGVEVENLGHMGHRLVQDSGPRILDSLRAQQFDISLFLSSYIWEFAAAGGGTTFERGYESELRTRIGLAQSYGGLCLIADPSPLPLVLGGVIGKFEAINRRVAAALGCTYYHGLTHLWNPATAVRRGITLVDDVHPRAPGYRLMSKALAPVLAKMVRERVRTRGY